MAAYVETPDSADSIPCELWEGIDSGDLRRAIQADRDNTGKSSFDRLSDRARNAAEKYMSSDAIASLRDYIPS